MRKDDEIKALEELEKKKQIVEKENLELKQKVQELQDDLSCG